MLAQKHYLYIVHESFFSDILVGHSSNNFYLFLWKLVSSTE